MTPPNRTTKARRLEAAGFAHVDGWVPSAYAAKVMQQVSFYADDVEQIASKPRERGRPKKSSDRNP